MNKIKPYAIVGDGFMAGHFCNYLTLSGIPYRQWSRRKNGAIDPSLFFNDCSVLLLLIKDDAIQPFIEKYKDLKKLNPVHFSGSLYLKNIPSIHPLMTFSKEFYSLEKYREIPFIHEKGEISFKELFPMLPNHSQSIDSDKKPLYHSLCVLSGNFSTMLWQKVFSDFKDKLDIEPDLLLPYMEQIFENLKTDRTNALTGPIARKDMDTIKNNINALDGDIYQNVYKSFAETVIKKGALL